MNIKNPNSNIETRISQRSRSIFAAFGTIVNDFYLEAGIYFVGGFNAALVAWDIYTSLVADPLPYAIAVAIISFIAVEGLAVYLVGAAAKTNNGLLWFFSVIFAAFFTYAHYREMSGQGIIAQYITLAIPFFVVVGYWARTVKVDIENSQIQTAQQRDEETARQQRLEDEAIAHNREMERIKSEQKQAQKMAQIEVQKSVQSAQTSAQMNQMNRQNDLFEPANGVIKNKKMNRQNDLFDLTKHQPGLGPTELTRRLNEIGHSVSISTVKRDIRELNGNLRKVK